jgi:hypothetical protein
MRFTFLTVEELSGADEDLWDHRWMSIQVP